MLHDEKSPFARWTKFLQKTKSSNTPTLNRFAARYQLSVKFKGIDANLSAKTLDGYSRIFHVFLAYSAFETLLKGTEELSEREVDPMSVELDIDKHNYLMIDDQIADSIRKINPCLMMFSRRLRLRARSKKTQLTKHQFWRNKWHDLLLMMSCLLTPSTRPLRRLMTM
jgi:hypothetical protein